MTEHTPDVVHLTLNEAFVSVFCFVSTSLLPRADQGEMDIENVREGRKTAKTLLKC